jgi:FKBP-type peptidyl-prolyl cis-trans isomerase
MKLLSCLFIFITLVSCNKEEKLEMKSDTQKMYYAMGYQYGERLAELSPTEKDLQFYQMGLSDGAFMQKEKVDTLRYSSLAGQKLTEIRGKLAESTKKEAQQSLDKLMKEDTELKKSKSGLIYKVIKKGNKRRPKKGQFVKIEFKSMHLDGKVFDQTSPQNIPTLPLDGILPAWREGLKMLGVGGEIKMIAPSHLAFGDAGAPPKVKGGESIIFEMKLVDIFNEYPPKK